MLVKKAGLFLGPAAFFLLLLLPAPDIFTAEAWRVLALAAFMLIWWVTEAVSISVTALLPLVGLPILGIDDFRTVAAPYASPVVFLFMGGFMIALAMEKWNLHQRIALNIVRLTGTNANGVILGFMLATALLSMWISNTATAVMMFPIALSVIDLLTRERDKYPERGIRNFSLTMMLGIAYAANIGGTATIIGTPPNVVFAGYIRQTFDYDVSFARWMLVGIPFAGIMLAATYFFLVRWLYPNGLGRFAGAQALIDREIANLGRISTAEKRTLGIFLATALGWIFRGQINRLVPSMELSDPLIAMFGGVLLFVTPVNFRRNEYLLKWEDTSRLPWGILLLFGGGLSLAGALERTGIVDLIGQQFVDMERAGFFLILALAAVSLFLTEIMSNVALVTIFLPVVGGIAVGAGIPPLLVCIPVTLAASCAFMLPMSTPPNAIVFASGHLTIPQMARAGIMLNLITVLLVAIMARTLLVQLFSTM